MGCCVIDFNDTFAIFGHRIAVKWITSIVCVRTMQRNGEGSESTSTSRLINSLTRVNLWLHLFVECGFCLSTKIINEWKLKQNLIILAFFAIISRKHIRSNQISRFSVETKIVDHDCLSPRYMRRINSFISESVQKWRFKTIEIEHAWARRLFFINQFELNCRVSFRRSHTHSNSTLYKLMHAHTGTPTIQF